MTNTPTAAPPKELTLAEAQQELEALQTEYNGIATAQNAAVEKRDPQLIVRLRQRRAELEQLIPAQTVTFMQVQEAEYKRRSAEAEAEAGELAWQVEAADERARVATAERNRLMGELSNLQSIAREYRQYASQVAGQCSQMLRKMQGQEVDRALRMPLQNPNYGN